MTELNLKKFFFFLLFLSFLFNCFNIIKVNKKFNQNVTNDNKILEHKIIKGDSLKYWNIASELENNFFLFPLEYRNAQLYSKIIFIFSKLTNQNLFDENGNAILDLKFNIFYFQLIFYFFALFLLYYSLLKIISTTFIPELIILILSVDPFINQVHYAIYTESIFISLLIIFISFFIRLNLTSIKNCLFLGFLLGFLFLQRAVVIYYIFFLTPLFLIYIQNQKVKSLASLFLGYSFVLFFVALSSYHSIGKFRITPTQSEDVLYGYLAPNIYAKQNNLTISKSKEFFFYVKNDELINENNLNVSNFNDFDSLLKLKKSYAREIIFKEPLTTIQVLIYNYSKNLFIHYNWVTEFFNSPGKKNRETIQSIKRDDNFIIKRGVYSLIFLSITFLGFVFSFKILNSKIILFLSISGLYYFIVSGWIGNPRYFLPSYLFAELFFGIGFYYLFRKIFIKIKLIKQNFN